MALTDELRPILPGWAGGMLSVIAGSLEHAHNS
jgi:hypothetical protein